jgi:hypothetical protein
MAGLGEDRPDRVLLNRRATYSEFVWIWIFLGVHGFYPGSSLDDITCLSTLGTGRGGAG